jgi:hypothetical protein
MEVYQQRLWVAGKDAISFSAPSNGADFSTTNGGGSIGYFGDKLTYSYMDLCASSGYLFVFGDSSTDIISNVQLQGTGTTGSPFVTNFNYANADPQVGQKFPRTVGRVGRYMIMWNGAGIFLMQGSDAQQISGKVTTLADLLDTSLYYPTMCSATIFGFRVLLVNGRFTDPFGVKRNLILVWHPVQGQPFWSVMTQNLELTHIGHYEQDSSITPYGTDGTSLYQLFATPDPALPKRLSTKSLRGTGIAQLVIKNFKRLYLEVQDIFGQGLSITGTVTTADGGVPAGAQSVGFDMPAGYAGPGKAFQNNSALLAQPLEGAGISASIDLTSLAPDFVIERIHLASEQRTLFGA